MAPSKTLSPRQLYELKKKAQEFYEQNGVPKKMELILNSMFYDNPLDVYGHLANYFEDFALKPTITKVAAREVLDSKGQVTLQAEVYGRVKNNEKLLSTAECSSENFHPDHVRPEEKDAEDEERKEGVAAALKFISGDMGTAMVSLEPTDQNAIDSALTSLMARMMEQEAAKEAEGKEEMERETQKTPSATAQEDASHAKAKGAKSPKGKKGPPVEVIPDEPREKLLPGCGAICALSQAVCLAGAHVSGVELFQHIAQLSGQENDGALSVPSPMITILSGGRAGPGKMKGIKEYMIVPRHDMPISEVLKHASNVFNIVGKTAVGKATPGTARYYNDIGALCPAIDRLEQGLDMLTDAFNQLELTAGQDFFFALNCAAHEVFDFDKGKYEAVTGQLKDGEGLVEMWADLVYRYPAVIALIDPLRKQDKEAWTQLCEKISSQCLIMGDFIFHRPGLLKDESLSEEVKTSGIIMKLEQMTSVSDVIAVSNKMKEANQNVALGTSVGENSGCFLSDLAVGVGARFIKIGAPCRGERVVKLNRLAQIEAHLTTEGKLCSLTPLTFPNLAAPSPQSTPPPDALEGSVDAKAKETVEDKPEGQTQEHQN